MNGDNTKGGKIKLEALNCCADKTVAIRLCISQFLLRVTIIDIVIYEVILGYIRTGIVC